MHKSQPDSHSPSADWEIDPDELHASRTALQQENNRKIRYNIKTPTEINLDQIGMNTDEFDLNHSLEQSLTTLDETKSALHDAESENVKLRADLAELRLNFVSMQNDISRFSSNSELNTD